MTLFTLRYRKGNVGVALAFVQVKESTGDRAKDMRIAEAIGQQYCNDRINHKYIRVEEAILADESIVNAVELESLRRPTARPKPEKAPAVPARTPLEDAPNASAVGDNNLDDLGDEDEDEDDEDEDTDSNEDEDDDEPASAPKPKATAKVAPKTAAKTAPPKKR